MQTLPSDVVVEIFTHLTWPGHLRLVSVCKRCRKASLVLLIPCAGGVTF